MKNDPSQNAKSTILWNLWNYEITLKAKFSNIARKVSQSKTICGFLIYGYDLSNRLLFVQIFNMAVAFPIFGLRKQAMWNLLVNE